MTVLEMSEISIGHRKTSQNSIISNSSNDQLLAKEDVDTEVGRFPYVCSKTICCGWSIIDDFSVDTVLCGLPFTLSLGFFHSLAIWPSVTWKETSMTSKVISILAKTTCCLEIPLVTSNWIRKSAWIYHGTRLLATPSRTISECTIISCMFSIFFLILQ